MIPTIQDIIAAVAAGTMSQEAALSYIDSHIELERGDLRELFAAHALQGMLSHCTTNLTSSPTWFAKQAFAQADAMLEARKA